MKLALLIALSYLLGSVPFGLIFARARGVDLRRVGSGNIGATNALRAVGKAAAFLTLAGDLLKGTAAVALGRAFGLDAAGQGALGLAAVAGHDFSIFLRLRGGKGVATSIGVLLIYSPLAGILTVAIWLIAVLSTRYSSLGAVVSFACLPAVIALVDFGAAKLAVAAVMAPLLIWKHRENIKRLLEGREGRVGG
ncbi:MAG: glycerol-3-phosphate 1-O-acyltransferase PlsY [Thermodesulfovibrionales bacterium]